MKQLLPGIHSLSGRFHTSFRTLCSATRKIFIPAIFLFFVSLKLPAQVFYANTINSIDKIIVTPSGCIVKPSGFTCPVVGKDSLYSIAMYKDTMYILTIRSLYYTTRSHPGECHFIMSIGGMNSATTDNNGILYLSGGETIIRYDPHTGDMKFINGFPFAALGDLTFYKGDLYMSAFEDKIVKLNLDTPQLSKPVVQLTIPYSAFGLATGGGICPGRKVYVTISYSPSSSGVFALDLDNGIQLPEACTLNAEYLDATSLEGESTMGADIEQVSISPPCYGSTLPSRVVVEAYSANGEPLTYLLNNGMQNNTGIFTGVLPGNYHLRVSSGSGCFADTAIMIEKKFCNQLTVPTAFTPNHDGKNDVLRARGLSPGGPVYFEIFNRWGQKIFESRNIDHGWDGTFNGTDQPTDTYIWVLQFTDENKKIVVKKGTCTLIR